MKQHHDELLLIEPDPAGMWQIVARQTNRRGLDAGPMPVISTHPDLPTARRRLKWIKQGATHEHP